ncbi:MAG: murein biosynthesis integral membrane protein MurJ [Phycisphaerales bacterium]
MPGETPKPEAHHAIGRSVLSVSGLTVLSRILGLARDVTTARIFGDTVVGSAFAAAFAVPNLFRRLFGEGALSAAFLPEYTRLSDGDRDQAGAFASVTAALLSVVTWSITIIAELALLLVVLIAPGDADRQYSLLLVMALLPYMPLICTAAILGGMLQAHGRFWPWAASPILLNLCILGASVPFFFVDGADPRAWSFGIGAATVVSGVLQLAWSWAMLRGRVAWTRAFSSAKPRAIAMLKRMGPVLIGLGTLQVNGLIDTFIAMYPNWVGPTLFGRAYPLDDSSNAILFYAQRLYQFPLGVFGIAVATVAFPALSRAWDGEDREGFRRVIARAIRLSVFIALPAAVGLVLVRDDLVRVVYSGFGGGFSAGGVERASAVLLGYSWAIWAYSINQVLTRAFFASGDTTTPMRIAIAMVGVNIALNLTLIWHFREAGLAWSTAICATLQGAALWLAARSKLIRGSLLHAPGARAIGRCIAVTAVMGGAVYLIGLIWTIGYGAWGSHAARLGVACVAGVIVYGVGSALFRAPEIGWLTRRTPDG